MCPDIVRSRRAPLTILPGTTLLCHMGGGSINDALVLRQELIAKRSKQANYV
jgi:hypothetical protein